MARAPRDPLVSPSSSQRLDSWKEIAVYLRRSVSTVKRWEREEEMPVHRHLHEVRGTVYAYKPEIDAWWHGRESKLEQGSPAARLTLSKRFGSVVVALAALALVAAAILWMVSRSERAGDARTGVPLLAFAERDWVLVADFDNRTGQAELDGTLEYALKRELSTSRFVNVVPRPRINDALRLMKRPAESSIDRALGREICLRDGAIRGLVSGRVDRLGDAYLLNVELIDPATGGVAVVLSEQAPSQERLLQAVSRLSIRVREALGEALPRFQSPEPLVRSVTTPSLRALQLYSQADALLRKTIEEGRLGDYPSIAEELLKGALELDPDFAAAHAWLAWAGFYQQRPPDEYIAHATRGRSLSAHAHERERYAIVGSFHQLRAARLRQERLEGGSAADSRELERVELEQAVAAWGALLRLYPDDFWAPVALASTYSLMSRFEEHARYLSLVADQRPNSFAANVEAAWALSKNGNRTEAKHYLVRAGRMYDQGAHRKHWAAGWMLVVPAEEHWLRGEVEEVLREADRLVESLGTTTELSGLAYEVSALYLAVGRLESAEQLLVALPDASSRHEGLARLAFLKGDERAVRQHLGRRLDGNGHPKHVLFHLLIRLGELSEAERILPELSAYLGGYFEVARGELDLARGYPARAVPQLQAGLDLLPLASFSYYFGTESLASALRKQGDFEGAIRVLKVASAQKARVTVPKELWMRNQLLLAASYRDLGRVEEARRIEVELAELLRCADADHPMLLELDRRRELDAALLTSS